MQYMASTYHVDILSIPQTNLTFTQIHVHTKLLGFYWSCGLAGVKDAKERDFKDWATDDNTSKRG